MTRGRFARIFIILDQRDGTDPAHRAALSMVSPDWKEDYLDMNLMDYIIQDAYILVPVLYVIGIFLKRTPKVPDWLIPWILTGLGMIGAFFLSGMKLSGILQGVLVAGVTVFANQLYKQTINRQ